MTKLFVWDYTALRDGREVEKGRVVAPSLSACLERVRTEWKYGPPPDDWRITPAAISADQLKQARAKA